MYANSSRSRSVAEKHVCVGGGRGGVGWGGGGLRGKGKKLKKQK